MRSFLVFIIVLIALVGCRSSRSIETVNSDSSYRLADSLTFSNKTTAAASFFDSVAVEVSDLVIYLPATFNEIASKDSLATFIRSYHPGAVVTAGSVKYSRNGKSALVESSEASVSQNVDVVSEETSVFKTEKKGPGAMKWITLALGVILLSFLAKFWFKN